MLAFVTTTVECEFKKKLKISCAGKHSKEKIIGNSGKNEAEIIGQNIFGLAGVIASNELHEFPQNADDVPPEPKQNKDLNRYIFH